MYVNIRRYSGVTSAQDVVSRARKDFIPLVSKISGFNSYHIIDAGNGVLATISTFDSKDGADESVRIAADWIRSSGLSANLPTPPEITAGEAFS